MRWPWRTVLESVRHGVQQGLLDPPSLPAAELAVVMTAAEIRQLELLIQHCSSLGIDEVTASQDDKMRWPGFWGPGECLN